MGSKLPPVPATMSSRTVSQDKPFFPEIASQYLITATGTVTNTTSKANINNKGQTAIKSKLTAVGILSN